MTSQIDFETFLERTLQDGEITNLYFLLDHGGLPGLHRQLSRTSMEWKSLFDGSGETNALAVAPILISAVRNGQLQAPPSFLKWLRDDGTYASSILVLSSTQDLIPLADRLTARLDVELSENMRALLRFFDARVFEALTTVLNADQLSMFLRPAAQWWYVDRSGHVINVEAVFSEEENPRYRLVLSATQEFALVDACEIDQVVSLLSERIPDALGKLPRYSHYEFVAANVMAAKRVGLNAIEDFVLYNVVALTMGRPFMESATWSSILRETEQNPGKFSQLILDANLDDTADLSVFG